jgi:hypothetical protein
MARIGRQLVQSAVVACTTENGSVDKDDMGRRDLLSLLIRANMATDLPESQRLSEDDVIARTCCVLPSVITIISEPFCRDSDVFGRWA